MQEYFDIWDRRNNWQKGVCYRIVGKPSNILEELAYSEHEYIEELYYCNARYNHPEDMCESRTDWDMMREYADRLASFIERIKEEIGSGKLKYEE